MKISKDKSRNYVPILNMLSSMHITIILVETEKDINEKEKRSS